ncbi:MAG: hypothetical protein GY821_07375 [Gammaproteobacteria bacterium]|nr:hypothetical protein [Gammaproteobacteria bacterium]
MNYVSQDGYSQYVKLMPRDASSSYRTLYESLQTAQPDCCDIRPYTQMSPGSSTMWWPNKGKKVTLYPLQIHLQPPFNCALQMIHL